MSWLFLDTSASGSFRVGTISSKKIDVQHKDGRSHLALNMLASRVKLSDWKAIEGICVVSGPGSFSAVRTGVLTANLLSRLLKKPLVGVSVEDAQDLEVLAGRLERGEIPTTTYVAPSYNAEPNITIS